MSAEAPTFIDLFAGAGGFSLGFYQAGLKGIMAVERDPMAFHTLQHNLIDGVRAFDWPSWFTVAPHDIGGIIAEHEQQLIKLRGSVGVVSGGPPCQGFSHAGRRLEHDERNQMFKEYVRFVKLVRPRLILFENVPGFAHSFRKNDHHATTYVDKLTSELKSIGFEPPSQAIVDFSRFGVPQARKRLIIVSGEKGCDCQRLFESLRLGRPRRRVTTGEAISDLFMSNGTIQSPDSARFKVGLYGKPNSDYQKRLRSGVRIDCPDSHRFANHSEEVKKRFKMLLKIGIRNKTLDATSRADMDLKKRNIIPLDENGQSPTLTTLPDDYIHYSEPRILTVREYARLQSFPDWYEFKGNYTTGGERRAVEIPRYTQVANAVAPFASFRFGKALTVEMRRS